MENWIEEEAEKLLKTIGIREGQKVLDFGCGSGNYTIPVARIVGKKGLVYALDQDKGALDGLMHKAELMGLKNIIRLDASPGSRIGLDNESVDVVLIFDVLHYYYFPRAEDRKRLLREVYRVLKPNAVFSLYPAHLESNMEPKLEEVRREIAEANFYLESEYSGLRMAHDNEIEEGRVMNFRKVDRQS